MPPRSTEGTLGSQTRRFQGTSGLHPTLHGETEDGGQWVASGSHSDPRLPSVFVNRLPTQPKAPRPLSLQRTIFNIFFVLRTFDMRSTLLNF